MNSYTSTTGSKVVGIYSPAEAINPEMIDATVAAKVEDAEQRLSSPPSYSTLRRLNKIILQVLCTKRGMDSKRI
jgi:hypothetical protein